MKKNKKSIQLGMPHGTAANQLRKLVLFDLLQKAKLNICYQCGEKISIVRQLSIEHKIPWMNSLDPIGLFWDLDNIAFSHLSCNSAASTRVNKVDLTNRQKLDIRNKKRREARQAESPEEREIRCATRRLRRNNT